MERQWEKNQCSLQFARDDGSFARQRYNHVVDGVSDEQIGAFSQAIAALKDEPLDHTLLTQVYRFEPKIEA